MFVLYYWCPSINNWRDEDIRSSLGGAIAFAIKVAQQRKTPVILVDENGERIL